MAPKKTKFVIILESVSPFVHGVSRLAQIADEANLVITPLTFRLVASSRSLPFVATLQLNHHTFAAYDVDNDHYTRLSLESLHSAMLDCTFSSSVAFHLFDKINLLYLQYKNPNDELLFRRQLWLLPHREQDLEEIEYAKFFSIDVQDLRRVIRELPLYRDEPVCVIATGTKVKFSIGSREIVIEDGEFESVGLEDEDETRIQITLNPMMFFLTLSYECSWVFFHRTMSKSHSVMILPVIGLQAQYMFYFPLLS